MTKPLKFYQTLNQAPRSPKHGKHRRASPQAYDNPTERTDYGTGRSGTITWTTIHSPFSWDYPEPTIPHAGIRTGELIGHRLWWLLNDGGEQWLCSLAHRRLWQSGETITGDLAKVVGFNIIDPIYGGTYAFAEASNLIKESEECINTLKDLARQREQWGGQLFGVFHPCLEAVGLAEGTIKMWGEVVEHERGYRAEFAKLVSIDKIWGDGDLNALRLKYQTP